MAWFTNLGLFKGAGSFMYENELIQSILSGREEGFSLLVKKYMANVFRVVMGFVHNKEEAEDISQEVFVKAWQSLSQFNQQSSFSTWLIRIAIHESLNYLKKKKRKKSWESIFTFIVKDSSFSGTPIKVEEKEEWQYVREVLGSLSPKQNQAFVLIEYEGMTQREAAEVMGVSEGAVEQLMIRARSQLKKKLEKYSPKA